jgi:hypothetical protein
VRWQRSAGVQSLCSRAMRRSLGFDAHSSHPAPRPSGGWPARLFLNPVPRRSAVNLDSVESVSVAVLVNRLGRLADTRMRAICAALEVAVDCSG